MSKALTSIIGFVLTVFGFGILIYVIGRYLWEGGSEVPGFPFLAATIAIFSGNCKSNRAPCQ